MSVGAVSGNEKSGIGNGRAGGAETPPTNKVESSQCWLWRLATSAGGRDCSAAGPFFFFLPWWSAKSTSPLVRLGAGDGVFQTEDNCGIRDVMLVAMCLRGCHCVEYIHSRPWFPMHGFNSGTRFALGAFRLRQVLEYIPLKKDIKKKKRNNARPRHTNTKVTNPPNSPTPVLINASFDLLRVKRPCHPIKH